VTHLLDANALIALCWPAHEHHARMTTWFKRNASKGWATCALTQSAFIRILLQPAVAGRALAVNDVAELLLRNTAHPHHKLVPLDFGFEQVLVTCTGGLQGHRQITDAWLLTTAARHGIRLLTLDGGIASLLATAAERQAYLSAP
jgi:uncharacterized protein